MNKVQKLLFEYEDKKNKDFFAKLVPTLDKDSILGVRTPQMKKIGKMLATDKTFWSENEKQEFLKDLPHKFYEENNVHGFIISQEKDNIEKLFIQTNEFLPYVDNWATCDSFSPKLFAKYTGRLLQEIYLWLDSDRVFTVRFSINMLMKYFLNENFTQDMFIKVASIKTNEYYINMAIAWYLSVALVKQYDYAIQLFENRLNGITLDKWLQNKAIQKAIESFRISDEKKEYIKSLKK